MSGNDTQNVHMCSTFITDSDNSASVCCVHYFVSSFVTTSCFTQLHKAEVKILGDKPELQLDFFQQSTNCSLNHSYHKILKKKADSLIGFRKKRQ